MIRSQEGNKGHSAAVSKCRNFIKSFKGMKKKLLLMINTYIILSNQTATEYKTKLTHQHTLNTPIKPLHLNCPNQK